MPDRPSSWLGALVVLALGLAACGGGLLYALDEMREAHDRASSAEARVGDLETTVDTNRGRIEQLERELTTRGIEVPPPPATTTTARPERRSTAPTTARRSSTTTTTRSAPPSAAPAAPSTTSPAAPPTTATSPPSTTTTTACLANVLGVCV